MATGIDKTISHSGIERCAGVRDDQLSKIAVTTADSTVPNTAANQRAFLKGVILSALLSNRQ